MRALGGVTKIRDAIQHNALTVHPVGLRRRLDGLMPFNPWGVSSSRWGDVEFPERSEEDTSKQRAVNLLNMSIAISKNHARP